MIPHPDFDDGQGPYVANVSELDYRTGQILDGLDAARVAEETIVVWASDNAAAEIMGGSSGAWRGKFGGGWEGSIRTPAMIRWPDRVPSNTETDEIVATYDWMPTLAAMVGRSDLMPTDRPIDGIDMSTFVLGDTDSSGRTAGDPADPRHLRSRRRLQRLYLGRSTPDIRTRTPGDGRLLASHGDVEDGFLSPFDEDAMEASSASTPRRS
jgi:arylsulfatase A-like enzyme